MACSRRLRSDRLERRKEPEGPRGRLWYGEKRRLTGDKQLNRDSQSLFDGTDDRAIDGAGVMRTLMPTHVRVHGRGAVMAVMMTIEVRMKERRTQRSQLHSNGDETRENGPEHWPSLFARPVGPSSNAAQI